jgi:hypothetical protein
MPSLTISLSLKSRLRSSTRGDSYGLLGFNPALVFDFKGNYFRKSETASTFGASITHAATTNATMTDGYGPEVVTNGKFGTDTAGWASGASAATSAAVSGEMQVTNVSSNGRVVTAIPTVVGRRYEVSGVGRVRSGGGGPAASLYLTNSGGGTLQGGAINYTTTDAPLGLFFTATATTSYISAITFGSVGNVSAFDNVSVRESPVLKWRPHNLINKSNTFDTWDKSSSITIVGNNAVGPNGIANTADTINFSSAGAYLYNLSTVAVRLGDKVTLAAWVRSDTITSITFATNGRTNGANNTSEANLAVTPTWTLVSFESTVAGNDIGLFFIIGKYNVASPAAQIGDLEFYGAHMFRRSDLGGMVNNPDASTGFESYVPTTTSAVYLSRRGQHLYNGSAWVNEGILHESEARTNLLTYSGAVTSTGWYVSALNVGAVTAGSPFGSYQSASPPSTASTEGQAYQIGKPLTSGATYVAWSLVKYSAGNGWFSVSHYNVGGVGGGNQRGWFDLQNGVVGSKDTTIIDHGMIDYGDGWWLCWASKNAESTSGGINLGLTTGDGTWQSRNSGDVIQIAGSQFELGSTPSSYILTTSASATRAAETLTVPAANLPYNSTNMSFQMDGKMTYADNALFREVSFVRWVANGTNYIESVMATNGYYEGRLQFSQRQSTSGLDGCASSAAYFTPDTNVPFNIASRHGSTFLNGAEGGTALTANTTPTALPDLSATDLLLGNVFMGTIGEFRMWSEDLGDVGITEATLPSTEPSLSLTFDGSENSFTLLDWSE